MSYDMTRCPQTEDEFREYFYTLIGRTYGAPADGWEAVMSAAYPWGDDRLPIPEGVGPGIKQQPGAPFFGLTQQYSGGPKGRIFLPTATPDDLGYYTRCLQYLDDAAGTYSHANDKKVKTIEPTSSGLIWSWYWVAGHEYTPIQGSDSGGGTTPPVPSDLELRVTVLEAAVNDLGERVTAIEAMLVNGLHAHGPINLPIVLESLTSLRCKGDIDVQVKPGQATPPPDTSSAPPDLATVVLLKKLIERRNAPEES